MKDNKIIQSQFGQHLVMSLASYANHHTEELGADVIDAISTFARKDIDTRELLEQKTFDYIADEKLRQALSKVLFGARWLYKLGLALLVKGGSEERAAHVRAQIIDYASVVEAILVYCNGFAIDNNHALGNAHHWMEDGRQLDWSRCRGKAANWSLFQKRSFWWHAGVAKEFGIVSESTFKAIDVLREDRNTVHVRQHLTIDAPAYMNQSKVAFETLLAVNKQARAWCSAHPAKVTPAQRKGRSRQYGGRGRT